MHEHYRVMKMGNEYEEDYRIVVDDDLNRYRQTHKLSMELIQHAWMGVSYGILYPPKEVAEIMSDFAEVEEALRTFKERVFFDGGLREYLLESTYRGHRVIKPTFWIRTFGLADRLNFSFSSRDDSVQVHCVTTDDSKKEERHGGRISLTGIKATAHEAEDLIWQVVSASQKGRLKFAPFKKDGFYG